MRILFAILGRMNRLWRQGWPFRPLTGRTAVVWLVLVAYLSTMACGPVCVDCEPPAVDQTEAMASVDAKSPEHAAAHGGASMKSCCQKGSGGCQCSLAARNTGNCCCAGKQKAKSVRSCCASKVAKSDEAKCEAVAASAPADDEQPSWNSCTCGHAPVTASIVTADPWMVNDRPSLHADSAGGKVFLPSVLAPLSVSSAPETPPPECAAA